MHTKRLVEERRKSRCDWIRSHEAPIEKRWREGGEMALDNLLVFSERSMWNKLKKNEESGKSKEKEKREKDWDHHE